MKLSLVRLVRDDSTVGNAKIESVGARPTKTSIFCAAVRVLYHETKGFETCVKMEGEACVNAKNVWEGVAVKVCAFLLGLEPSHKAVLFVWNELTMEIDRGLACFNYDEQANVEQMVNLAVKQVRYYLIDKFILFTIQFAQGRCP